VNNPPLIANVTILAGTILEVQPKYLLLNAPIQEEQVKERQELVELPRRL